MRCHLDTLPTELLLTLFPLLDAPSLAFLARSCKRLWHTVTPHLYHSPDIPSLRTLQRLAHTLACDAGIDQSNPSTYINLPDYLTKRRGRSHTPVDDQPQQQQQDAPSTSTNAPPSSSDPRLLALYESSSTTASPCRLIRHLRIVSLAAMSGKWDHTSARTYAPAIELLARAVRRAYWLLTLLQPLAPAFSPTSPSFAHSPCGFAALDLAHTWDLPDLKHLPDSTVQILALNVGPMLKSLDVEQCVLLGPNAVLALAAHCPNLQELRVADGPRVSDASLEGLATGCKHLLMLDLTGAEEITSVGLRAVVSACHKLTEVKARGCFGVMMSDEEVAEMVQTTGRPGLVVDVGKREFSSSGDEDSDDYDEDEDDDDAMEAVGTWPPLTSALSGLLGALPPEFAAGTSIYFTAEDQEDEEGASDDNDDNDDDGDAAGDELDHDDGFDEHVVSGEDEDMDGTLPSAFGGGIEFDDGFMGALVGEPQYQSLPIVPASSVSISPTPPMAATDEQGGGTSSDQPTEDEHLWTDDE
ncbi:hypothetical protein BCR44DRAFT_36378 [Catenaria anguillulae PL171]|uniref:F-box domain-containing protein n=1 Tax=Catenaria anguillulae PL171 TaxID=765915 RepID=A0A1Y2HSD9_9FUNG|nr:hypothetical protein BCR44DRAFT_36378 [Catenaria anguillulae PL171]